jgi:hypothetical protein
VAPGVGAQVKPQQIKQQHTYTVISINIKTSDEEKYLGIILTSDILWGKHM